MPYFNTGYRFARFLRFKYIKRFVYVFFRLWIRKIHNIENLKLDEPCIIISNHSSYFDFWTLESIIKNRAVFVAGDIMKHKSPIVRWLLKLPRITFVDREKPTFSSLRKMFSILKKDRLPLVIYPEGTRSRTGKIQPAKIGFIQFALKARVPILPVAMKGTYEILPPQAAFPKFKRCEIIIGPKFDPHAFVNSEHDKNELSKASNLIMRKLEDMLNKA